MEIIQPVVRFLEKKISYFPALANLYITPYEEVVKREIALAEITSMDKVLHLGCGSIPFTAIHVSRLTGSKIWALDRDPEAVKKAQRLTEKMGLGDRIEFFSKAGEEVSFAPFDVILVALQVEPKIKVLNNFKKNSAPGSRIIFRSPAPSFQDYYDTLPSDCRNSGEVSQNMKTFDRSILFRKERE